MKVLVIGATGATGSIAVRRLLDAGHEVTAFVRDPAKFGTTHERLRVAQGDVKNAASLQAALVDQEAVFSAMGPRSFKKDDLQEVFMRNLVAGMKAQGVKRLSNLSAWGMGDSYATVAKPFKYIFLPLFLKNVFADKARGEETLFASGLDYVNVRPGQLLNKPSMGVARGSVDGKGLKSAITREDVAGFMIEQLSSGEWVGKSVVIGY